VFDDEDVNQTYYGARYLNGVTNRFNSVDPLQQKYPGWSPYVYALANPIRLYDPNGLETRDGHEQLVAQRLSSNPGYMARQELEYVWNRVTSSDTYRELAYDAAVTVRRYSEPTSLSLFEAAGVSIAAGQPQLALGLAAGSRYFSYLTIMSIGLQRATTTDADERAQLEIQLGMSVAAQMAGRYVGTRQTLSLADRWWLQAGIRAQKQATAQAVSGSNRKQNREEAEEDQKKGEEDEKKRRQKENLDRWDEKWQSKSGAQNP
jgi:RHS repeat-associated protein